MRVTSGIRVAAVVVGVFASACTSDSSVSPSTTQPTTLAEILSELALPTLSGLTPRASMVPLPTVSALSPSGCSYSAAAQAFACPPVSAAGLTVTRSFALLSAGGTPQSQFDPSTTASVRASTTVAGTLTAGGSTMSIDQQQVLTLSGLLTGTHTLDGTSVMRLSGTVPTGTGAEPVNSTITTTIAKLRLPSRAAGPNAWPTEGTITMDMTSSEGASALPTTMRVILAFNGTSKVAVTITMDGVAHRCTIDLASAAPSCI